MPITLEQVANIRHFLGERIKVKLDSGEIIQGEWTDIGLDSSCREPSKHNGIYVDGKFYGLTGVEDVWVR